MRVGIRINGGYMNVVYSTIQDTEDVIRKCQIKDY